MAKFIASLAPLIAIAKQIGTDFPSLLKVILAIVADKDVLAQVQALVSDPTDRAAVLALISDIVKDAQPAPVAS